MNWMCSLWLVRPWMEARQVSVARELGTWLDTFVAAAAGDGRTRRSAWRGGRRPRGAGRGRAARTTSSRTRGRTSKAASSPWPPCTEILTGQWQLPPEE